MTFNYSNVPDDEYQVKPFGSRNVIDALHAAPRGGKATDISLLAAAETKYSNDYAYGVAFLPVILVLVLIVWFLMLVLMQCCGNSMNCTASSKNPHTGGKVVSADEKKAWRQKLNLTKFYSTVCALLAGAAVLVVVLDGLPQLNEVINDFDLHLISLQEVLDEGRVIITDYVITSSVAVVERDEILILSTDFCPNAEGNVVEVTKSNNAVVTVDFDESLQNYTTSLDRLSDFLYSASIQVGQNYIVARDEAYNIEDDLDRTESWWYYFTTAFFLIALVGNFYILGCVILGWCSDDVHANPFYRVNLKLVLPLYSFLVYFNWLLSASFIYLSILTADVCYGNPDSNIAAIIAEYELDWGGSLFEQVSYYIQGCAMDVKPETPTAFYDAFIPALNDASSAGFQFLAEFTDVTVDELSAACASDANNFLNKTSSFQELLDVVEQDNEDIVQILYCSNVNSIYVDLLHNTVCDPGVMALVKVSFALLSASVFGMVLISQIISWSKDDEIVEEHDDQAIASKNTGEIPQSSSKFTNRKSINIDEDTEGDTIEKQTKKVGIFARFNKKDSKSVSDVEDNQENGPVDIDEFDTVQDLNHSASNRIEESSKRFSLFSRFMKKGSGDNEEINDIPAIASSESANNEPVMASSFDAQVESGDNPDEFEIQPTNESSVRVSGGKSNM